MSRLTKIVIRLTVWMNMKAELLERKAAKIRQSRKGFLYP